ncbi:endonuclease/exonuclease/phosphatase family protein [Parvularcula dongshanensis]|uniref:Endonuclease/exonuclease/phosphatase family metal-dependent hydrolase n=1 Tax=Parvularcula dongshanensis TaxID=1173995 RepID=A0A840I5W6_9PROT|nr:endonuclease/exonuclease/phosphatase family protein [Parvularcula dongshanensis]MBB4660207.1 endonuclease/exonuclease/phosphatase family metal-dependent hydrolase [Parvularcula dongshanensis]
MRQHLPLRLYVSVMSLALAGCTQPAPDGAARSDAPRSALPSAGPGTAGGDDADDQSSVAFASPAACDDAVRSGARFEGGRNDGELRLATWNIRWFPDGTPREDAGTDLGWLACTLAFLDADVIALQEIKTTAASDVAWAVVTDAFRDYAGGEWQVDLQDCGGEGQQHTGFLYDADRVRLERASDAWEMNGASLGPIDPCAGNLRPGRAAYVRSLTEGGADFSLVAVHLDSGRGEKDFRTRQEAYDRLDGLFSRLFASERDRDLIVMGDFNTMGADGIMEGPSEIEALSQIAANEAPGFVLMPTDIPCTEYYRGQCGALDHIVVAAGIAEREARLVSVSGICAARNGERFPEASPPAAYEVLSDHCPVVLDLADEDRD